jgi:transposase
MGLWIARAGRSPSALSTGQAPATPAMMPGATDTPGAALPKVGPLAPGQRWSVARKREVVLRLLRGENVELLSRELGVPIFKLEQWRQKADAALDGALKEREAEAAGAELAAAMQRIGELSMENELLRAKMERPGPLVRRRSR